MYSILYIIYYILYIVYYVCVLYYNNIYTYVCAYWLSPTLDNFTTSRPVTHCLPLHHWTIRFSSTAPSFFCPQLSLRPRTWWGSKAALRLLKAQLTTPRSHGERPARTANLWKIPWSFSDLMAPVGWSIRCISPTPTWNAKLTRI